MSETAALAAVPPIESRGYSHPDVLVSTEWVAQHIKDPSVRLAESDEDLLLYETGHIPGAVKIDWVNDLNDPLTRDYLNRAQMEKLLRSRGISEQTTIVFYGDKNNWWMFAAPRSFAASDSTCRTIPMRAPCVAGISPAPGVCPGPAR